MSSCRRWVPYSNLGESQQQSKDDHLIVQWDEDLLHVLRTGKVSVLYLPPVLQPPELDVLDTVSVDLGFVDQAEEGVGGLTKSSRELCISKVESQSVPSIADLTA